VPCKFIDPLRENFGDEALEGWGKEIQTPFEGLVAQERGEPCPPIVNPADLQVEGDELLFRKLNSMPLLPSAFLLLLITHVESFTLSPIPLSFGTIRAAATTTCFRVQGLIRNSDL
jgi:hypothetical protein